MHNFGTESKIRPTMQVLKELLIINITICIMDFICHFNILLCGFKYVTNLVRRVLKYIYPVVIQTDTPTLTSYSQLVKNFSSETVSS